MNRIVKKSAPWAAFTVIAFSIVACGGRTGDDLGSPDDGTDPNDPQATPPPTCGEICRSAVDKCFPGGAITSCANDCEVMRSSYKGCKELDSFLRCMPMVPVICTKPDKVEFNGCNTERDALSRCMP